MELSDRHKLWVPYIILLAISPLLLYWYPSGLIAALQGGASQGAFTTADGRDQVYFFTIAAAVISFLFVSWSILEQERFKRTYFPLALVVAYVSTISVTMWYEQAYANLWDAYYRTDFWYSYYLRGFIPGYGWVVVDMALVLVAYPWMKRANARLVVLLLLLTVASFAAWVSVGYGRPGTSVLDYALNAISRMASQLVLVASVWPVKQGNSAWPADGS